MDLKSRKKQEEKEKLGCGFILASLDDLNEIKSKNFELVVSNIVVNNIFIIYSNIKV